MPHYINDYPSTLRHLLTVFTGVLIEDILKTSRRNKDVHVLQHSNRLYKLCHLSETVEPYNRKLQDLKCEGKETNLMSVE